MEPDLEIKALIAPIPAQIDLPKAGTALTCEIISLSLFVAAILLVIFVFSFDPGF